MNVIEQLRGKYYCSKKKLAESTKMTIERIEEIESTNKATLEELIKIMKAFGILKKGSPAPEGKEKALMIIKKNLLGSDEKGKMYL